MKPSAAFVPVVMLAACGGSSPAEKRVEVAREAGTPVAQSADPLRRVSRVAGSTFIEILEVRARDDGSLIYCTAVRGPQIVDARDPEDMKTLHELRSSKSHPKFSRCQHLDSDGDRIYFTNRGDRIQPTPFVSVVDSSASPPIELAVFTRADTVFEGISVANGLAYVAAHDQGLLVLELVGNELVERGLATGMDSAWGVHVVGSRAYVAESSGYLAIVDVSTPATPRLLARLEVGGSPQSVQVAGTTAYLAAGSDGLITVDVSDPAAPRRLAVVDTPGAALQVAVAGGHAYLADWNEVRVYDVANPAAPRLVATENVTTEESHSRVLGIGAREGVAFIGEWTGMYAYELVPSAPSAEITLGESAIEYGRVATPVSETVTVLNEGGAPLEISSVTATDPAFVPDRASATIAPGTAALIDVAFTPASDAPVTAALVLRTNDPDEPRVQIPLSANRKGAAVGDPAPPLSMSLVGGGQWNLAEHRGKVVVLAYFATF